MEEVFRIIPASNKAFWTLAVIAGALLALIALFAYCGYSARNMRFAVSPAGLRISGGLYGRTIPLQSLRLNESGIIDLKQSADYGPKVRTNGIGLPGYQAGWFKLRNGEKALLFVTDPSRVVRIPTVGGFTVLLSVQHPDAFLASLSKAAASF